MEPTLLENAKTLVRLALREDLDETGDVTTHAIVTSSQSCQASIFARQSGIIAGLDIARLVFQEVDSSLQYQAMIKDGDRVQKGEKIINLNGLCSSILIGERTALNFLGRLSGIATQTNVFAEKVKGTNAKILDTRKTMPGWRSLEKYAVRCGGGENHRFGLFDMFLIKENHIVSAGSIKTAVEKCRQYMATKGIQIPIEVEVKNIEELAEALALKVDRIMLDNMSIEQIRQCVEMTHSRIPLEASGNVSLDTVSQIAATGVDFISVGSLTHSVHNFDLSLLIQ